MMYFILTFFMGAAVGSFVNVLIDRTITGRDWVRGRSECDHCHKILKWYDMVPLLSYALYRARSRCCHTPLSYRYPLVELIVGMLFTWWLAVGFVFFRLVSAPLSVIQPLFWLVIGILILILALSDLFYNIVILNIVWVASATVLIYRLILMHYGAYQMGDLVGSLWSAGLSFAFFWMLWKITRGRGMADGDMYVALFVGLLLGYPKAMVGIMGSFVIGAAISILLIIFGIRKRKDTVPFVPFMMLSMVVTLLWGNNLISFLGL